MSSRILTIEIQQDQILSVLLVHGLQGIQVIDSACCPMPAQHIETEGFFPSLKDSLFEILSRIEKGYDKCMVSIPAIYFLFRTLDVPFKNKKTIEQIVPFELENYLPLQAGSFNSDFCILTKNSRILSGSNLISSASIQEETLDRFKAIFNECDIFPDVVTLGSGYPMALAFAGFTDPAGVCIYVHAEDRFASIHVIRFGEIVVSRAFLLDSDDPASFIKKNVTHTYLSFNERFKNRIPVSDIAVSGTASFIETLSKDIESQMDVVIQPFNILAAIKILPAPQSFAGQSCDHLQDGIAMAVNETKGVDGYNFTRQLSNLALFYQDYKVQLIFPMVLTILFFLAWSVQPITKIKAMENQIEQIDRSVVQVFQSCFPDIKNIVDPVHQMQVNVNALQKKKNMDFLNDYPLNIDTLNAISNALPTSMDIIFTRFVRTERTLLVSGSADQFNTIDKMKNAFNNIKIFKDVDINSASMDKIDNRVKFSLKISL
ncbi:MAG: GspL/Epsl periplasmic domain-containing protein [Pseudomonadota bacterium]